MLQRDLEVLCAAAVLLLPLQTLAQKGLDAARLDPP